MRNKFFIIPIFLLVIFSLTFVSAQTPRAYCVENGLDIVYKDQPTLLEGNDFSFSFHVYNSSDGSPLNDGSVFCAFHLYNSSGKHLFQNNNLSFISGLYDFSANILGGNFSQNGEYSFVVACFNNAPISESGACSDGFEVVPTGGNLGVLLIMGLLAFILIGFGIFLKNPALGFIGAVLLILSGMYSMIYGISGFSDLYTRGVAISLLGLGIIFMLASAYEWLNFDGDG